MVVKRTKLLGCPPANTLRATITRFSQRDSPRDWLKHTSVSCSASKGLPAVAKRALHFRPGVASKHRQTRFTCLPRWLRRAPANLSILSFSQSSQPPPARLQSRRSWSSRSSQSFRMTGSVSLLSTNFGHPLLTRSLCDSSESLSTLSSMDKARTRLFLNCVEHSQLRQPGRLSKAFSRQPAYADRIVKISFANRGTPSSAAEAVRAFSNLTEMDLTDIDESAIKQLAYAHRRSPMLFPNLQALSAALGCAKYVGKKERTETEAIWSFLASLKAVRRVKLRIWPHCYDNDCIWVESHLGSLFNSLPNMREVDLIFGENHNVHHLGDYLPPVLTKVKLFATWETVFYFMSRLHNPHFLPNLVELPDMESFETCPGPPVADKVAETWGLRTSLENPEADLAKLQKWAQTIARSMETHMAAANLDNEEDDLGEDGGSDFEVDLAAGLPDPVIALWAHFFAVHGQDDDSDLDGSPHEQDVDEHGAEDDQDQ